MYRIRAQNTTFGRWCAAALLVSALAGCPALEQVVVLDRENTLAVNPGSLSVTGPRAPAIVPGTLVTGGANGGFLRQVLGVQQHGGATQLLTAPVSLAEAVDRGLLVKNIEFTTEDLQQTGLLSREGDIRILRLRDIQLYRDHGAVVRISEAGLFCMP